MTFRTSSTTIVHHSLEDAAHATPPRRSTAAPPGGTENARGMPRAASLWALARKPNQRNAPFPRRRPAGPPEARARGASSTLVCVWPAARERTAPKRDETSTSHATTSAAARPFPPRHTPPPPTTPHHPTTSSVLFPTQATQLATSRKPHIPTQLARHTPHHTTPGEQNPSPGRSPRRATAG
jgi:hypothetical protein